MVTNLRIRDWEPDRIEALWKWGMAVEGVLIALPLVWVFLQPSPQRPGPSPRAARPFLVPQEQVDSLAKLGMPVTRENDSTLIVHWSESDSILVSVRDGQVAVAADPAVREKMVEELVVPLGNILDEAGAAAVRTFLWIVGIVYLPIPLALGTLTAVWWQRRGE